MMSVTGKKDMIRGEGFRKTEEVLMEFCHFHRCSEFHSMYVGSKSLK